MTLELPRYLLGDLPEPLLPLLSAELTASYAPLVPRSVSVHVHESVRLLPTQSHSILYTLLTPTSQLDKLPLWRQLEPPIDLPLQGLLAHPTDPPSRQSSRMPLGVSWWEEVPQSQ